MASDYSRTCASPDSIQAGEAAMVSETCEVYVWGSNSSHQLVEGTQEKILQPKLASSFSDAQTVESNFILIIHTLSVLVSFFYAHSECFLTTSRVFRLKLASTAHLSSPLMVQSERVGRAAMGAWDWVTQTTSPLLRS